MLTIGEVAAHAGINTSAIRYYEREGLLPEPARVSGQRRYDERVLARLSMIRLAQQAGLTIAEIRALLHDFPSEATPPVRWPSLAAQKADELDALIRRAQAMKAVLAEVSQCACATLDECGGIAGGDSALAARVITARQA